MPTSTGMQTIRPTVSRLGVLVSMLRQSASGAVVEEVMDRLRHRPVDPRHPFQVQQPGLGHAAGRAEMVEQRALALGADAGDLIEHRAADVARPLAAMGLDREPVRLVAQPLDKVEDRVARVQRQRLAAGQEEPLLAGVALGPLGDREQRQVDQAELGQRPPGPRRAGRRRRRSPRGRASCRSARSGSSLTSRAKRRCSTSRIMA